MSGQTREVAFRSGQIVRLAAASPLDDPQIAVIVTEPAVAGLPLQVLTAPGSGDPRPVHVYDRQLQPPPDELDTATWARVRTLLSTFNTHREQRLDDTLAEVAAKDNQIEQIRQHLIRAAEDDTISREFLDAFLAANNLERHVVRHSARVTVHADVEIIGPVGTDAVTNAIDECIRLRSADPDTVELSGHHEIITGQVVRIQED